MTYNLPPFLFDENRFWLTMAIIRNVSIKNYTLNEEETSKKASGDDFSPGLLSSPGRGTDMLFRRLRFDHVITCAIAYPPWP